MAAARWSACAPARASWSPSSGEPGAVTVTARLTFPHHRFLCTDTYEAVAAGVLVISRLHCERGRGDLPRFGACYRLDASWDDVEYLGRNGESYRDMCAQTQVERVRCRVEDMTEPNIRPQESGNRMDCQYVILSNGEKNVQVTAVDRPFELAVKPLFRRRAARDAPSRGRGPHGHLPDRPGLPDGHRHRELRACHAS